MDKNTKSLEDLSIYELRDVARNVGVQSPSSKKKDVLIQSVKDIISGKQKPHVKTSNKGRPARSIAQMSTIFDVMMPSILDEPINTLNVNDSDTIFDNMTENTALSFTQTTNVAFIICATPLITAIIARLGKQKEPVGKYFMSGSLAALTGVALLIFNGSFVLKLSPLGDFLTLCAALSWAFYSIIIPKLSYRYNATFITRKVFFYGIVTVLPFFMINRFNYQPELFLRPAVWMNLAFLGVLASLICFVVWNIILKRLGTIQASNYLYLNPLFTMIAASLILNERITIYAICGVILVLAGVFLSSKR